MKYFSLSLRYNFAILELDNIGFTIGLWHGLTKDEFVKMAAEQVDIQALTENLTMLGLVVRFSPLTICSLTNTCLTSPECPHYSMAVQDSPVRNQVIFLSSADKAYVKTVEP